MVHIELEGRVVLRVYFPLCARLRRSIRGSCVVDVLWCCSCAWRLALDSVIKTGLQCCNALSTVACTTQIAAAIRAPMETHMLPYSAAPLGSCDAHSSDGSLGATQRRSSRKRLARHDHILRRDGTDLPEAAQAVTASVHEVGCLRDVAWDEADVRQAVQDGGQRPADPWVRWQQVESPVHLESLWVS